VIVAHFRPLVTWEAISCLILGSGRRKEKVWSQGMRKIASRALIIIPPIIKHNSESEGRNIVGNRSLEQVLSEEQLSAHL